MSIDERPVPTVRYVALVLILPIVAYWLGMAVWNVVSMTDFSLPTYRNRPEVGVVLRRLLYGARSVGISGLFVAAVFTRGRGRRWVALAAVPVLLLTVGLSAWSIFGTLGGFDVPVADVLLLCTERLLGLVSIVGLVFVAVSAALRLRVWTTLAVVVTILARFGGLVFDILYPLMFGYPGSILSFWMLVGIVADVVLLAALVGALLLAWMDSAPAIGLGPSPSED